MALYTETVMDHFMHPRNVGEIENADGVQTLEADSVLFALGMKSVDASALEAAAKEVGAEVFTVGDAIKPGKVDQATRSGYLAGVDIAK